MGFAMIEYEIPNEKSADQMFEELGYIEHFGYETNEVYRTESSHCMGRSIIFQYGNQRILPPQTLTMQELKAINKKCLELRMDRGVINNDK